MDHDVTSPEIFPSAQTKISFCGPAVKNEILPKKSTVLFLPKDSRLLKENEICSKLTEVHRWQPHLPKFIYRNGCKHEVPQPFLSAEKYPTILNKLTIASDGISSSIGSYDLSRPVILPTIPVNRVNPIRN